MNRLEGAAPVVGLIFPSSAESSVESIMNLYGW
jgi:hypothetical protein